MSEPEAKTTRVDWALRYVRLGFPVFPLGVRSKHPMIPKDDGGNGCLDATLNEKQATVWWTRWPHANIGVRTGDSFFVLDKDLKKGGEESLEYLQHQHGVLPDTRQQTTGSGGTHYLFQLPDFRVQNSDSKLAPGIDIRGHHGYIVVAPSIHPETGRRYIWDGLLPLEEQPIAPAPSWLLDWLRRSGSRAVTDTPKPATLPPKLAQGQRHNTLLSIGGSMRRRGLTAEEIFPVLAKVNQDRCNPPYDEAHLRKMAESLMQYPPDARFNVFRAPEPVAPVAQEPPAAELPIDPADVEAAIDEAIGRNDLVGVIRLAPEVAKVRPQFRAVIKAKIKIHFGREFPESLAREFDRAIEDAAEDGQGQKPPAAPPEAGPDDPPGGPNLLRYPLTDAGNGERMVAMFGTEIRYCTEMKKWLVWDGKRWALDELNVMRQKGKLMARLLHLQALSAGDNRVAYEKHARASESYAAIANALGQAATEPGIPISALNLDQPPFLLNCINGVVDLRTGKLLPHNREFLITKLCPVAFDPKAKCPRFLRFIEWAMGAKTDNEDAELSPATMGLVGFLQRALGYGLTADVSEKAVFVFYGEGGDNGKTTLLTLFRDLLGRDYGNLLLIETVMAAKQTDSTARADLADLRGARFVQTSEVGKEDRLNEQRIKYLTQGMGYIKSRRLYENPLEFEATHKLFMDCNYRPKVAGVDEAIWRRLKLVPFEVTIGEEKKDKQLPGKLREELPGVLAWAVKGAMLWCEKGLGDPPEVVEASAEWRDHDDPLRDFLEDCCELGEEEFVSVADLSMAYQWWAKQRGERFPLGPSAFNERLYSKKFKQDRRRISGKTVRIWTGLQLTADVSSAVYRLSGNSAPREPDRDQ